MLPRTLSHPDVRTHEKFSGALTNICAVYPSGITAVKGKTVYPSGITAGKGKMDDQNRHHLGPVPRSLIPQGRAADSQDIAGAILFLCGRGGWYCNGTEIIIDGGRLSFSSKL
jgi:NAD(P)-dependent dehydrogenase (short-subunit alcohol dehydrogenase family)